MLKNITSFKWEIKKLRVSLDLALSNEKETICKHKNDCLDKVNI